MNQQKIKNRLNEIVKNSTCYNQVASDFLEFMCDAMKISREAIDPDLNKKIQHKKQTDILYQTGIKTGFVLY